LHCKNHSNMASIVGSAVDSIRNLAVDTTNSSDNWLKADSAEEIASDEDEKSQEIANIMKRMMQKNFDTHGHYFRGTHVKSLAFVKGTLTVSKDLPSELQQGIFQPDTSYEIMARYANEPSFVMPDSVAAPRGLGLKVFEVNGDRLNRDDGLTTQDFLFNNAPMVELTDIQTTLEIVGLREKYFDDKVTLAKEIAKRKDAKKQVAPTLLPNEFVVGATMFSQSAFAYGPYVAKYSLLPTSTAQRNLASKTIPSDAPSTFHRDHLHSYYTTSEATYSFRVQLASDIKAHPVEDASVPWSEDTAPWHEVATITFPAQESFSDDRRIWWEDKIKLSPWNGIQAHRPLGGINRLRKMVYAQTSQRRAEGNRQKAYAPNSIGDLPN